MKRTFIPLLTATGLALATVPVWAGDVFKGREVYQQKCVLCHGETGNGMMHGTPDFTQGQGNLKPDRELVNVINNGKGIMPGFQGQLKDEEIMDVIAFVRSLY